MPYQKHTWTCGEKITTEKLNNIEAGIEEHNNYTCNSTLTTVYEGTVTTVYDAQINAAVGDLTPTWLPTSYPEYALITLNGTEYYCPVHEEPSVGYGDNSFEEYPFFLEILDDGATISTPQAETFSVTIGDLDMNITDIAPCFDAGVKKVMDSRAISIPKYLSPEDSLQASPILAQRVTFSTHDSVTVQQGQYATVYVDIDNSRPNVMGYAIEGIYSNSTGFHLPTITGMRADSMSAPHRYVLEVYAEDSDITIPANAIRIDAIAFISPMVSSYCVLSGRCPSDEGGGDISY